MRSAAVKQAVFTGIREIFAFSGPIRRKEQHFRAQKGQASSGSARETMLVLKI